MLVSVGYGRQDVDEFLLNLKKNDITVVVDTITSKSRPEMHEDANYERYGIELIHDHERMHGHRSRKHAPNIPMSTNAGWRELRFRYVANYYMTDEPQAGLHEMIALHEITQGNVGFMCCEFVPWHCHRNVIAAHLTAAVGSDQVMHLIGGKLVPHKVWGPEPAIVNGLVTYPV